VNQPEIQITLPSRGHGGKHPGVEHGASALPGVLAVLMDTPEKQVGSIILSDLSEEDRPDSGVVLSSGVQGFKEGDHVAALPYAGIWYRDVVFKSHRYWEVRFYGIADIDEYDSRRLEPSDLVPITIEQGDTIEECIKPNADWVLIRRDGINDSQGGILLPDKAAYRNRKATVYSIGPRCTEVSPGDRIFYHGPAVCVTMANLIRLVPNLEGNPEDYCLIKESGIYCKL